MESNKRKTSNERDKTLIADVPRGGALAEYLERLFLPEISTQGGGMPQRVVLCAIYGASGSKLGPSVEEVHFSASHRPQREELAELANRLRALAEADAEVLGRSQRYGVFAYDLGRSERAIARHLFKVSPTGSIATAEDRASADLDDEDGGRLSQKLLLSLLDSERRDKRWLAELTMNVVTAASERDAQTIERLQEQLSGTWEKQAKLIAATEDALSRAEDRRLKREWASFGMQRAAEALDTVRGILPALAGRVMRSPDALVGGIKTFLGGLRQDQAIKLLGEYDDTDGRLVKAGVFDLAQTNKLVAIVEGHEPPSALGPLIASLRGDQMQQAQSILDAPQLAALVALADAAHALDEKAA